jgi:hypothetical protein
MIFGLSQKVRDMKFLVDNHSPTILTGLGVAGTISTAYLTGRASFKAAEIIAKETEEYNRENFGTENGHTFTEHDIGWSRKVRLVWRLYIPPIGAGMVTVASIIMANRLASTKIAALTVASAISERSLQEYKTKIAEKLTERQNTAIRDEIAQERVNNHPVNREVILTGTGEVLCYDQHTGRYFQSTVEEIKRAENKVNHELVNFMYTSASTFYEELGLPPTSYTDSVGWNANARVEVQLSSVLQDGKPCLAIDFVNPPTVDYAELHD